MHLKIIGHQDLAGLAQWDDFIMKSPRGHYCALSTWLHSFRAYGFDYSIMAGQGGAEGEIIGGMGLLSFKFLGSQILLAPIGPIIGVGHEHVFRHLMEAAIAHARSSGAFMLQLQIPYCPHKVIPATLPAIDLDFLPQPRVGAALRLVNAPPEMLYVELPSPEEGDLALAKERLIKRFRRQTRGSIHKAESNNLTLVEAKTKEDLQRAYALIEMSGKEQGYATRSWQDFGPIAALQVEKGQAVVLMACKDGQDLAVLYGVLAGRRHSNIMAATRRLETDLLAGHFLQWQAIQNALKLGLIGYDLTSVGTEGIRQFKTGFRPEIVEFIEPIHFVLKNKIYQAFMRISPFIRKYKKQMSKVVSWFLKHRAK